MKKCLWSIASLLLCACGGAEPEALQNNLADTRWVLTAIGENTGVKTDATGYATLHFNADKKITGQFACGTFTGDYLVEGSLVTISNLQSYNNVCGAIGPDTFYFSLMQSAKTYVKQGEGLTLSQGDGRQLNFVSQFAGCNNPLAVTGEALPVAGVTQDLHIVKIETKNIEIDTFIANLEKSSPDFVIQNTGSCSPGVVAQINPNTLAKLRCDNTVASIVNQ